MVKLFKRFYLSVEHSPCSWVISDRSEVDNFDGHLFPGSFIDATKDSGAKSSSNDISESIRVILDFLPQFVIS